ncbi:hypothetical protein Agub_g14556, partial [Astrephomene gubernaculifera]
SSSLSPSPGGGTGGRRGTAGAGSQSRRGGGGGGSSARRPPGGDAAAAVEPCPGWPLVAGLGASLDDLYRRSKEVLRKVKPYKPLACEDPSLQLLPRLRSLTLRLLAALAEAAEAVGAAAGAALRGLGRLDGRGLGSSGSGGMGSSGMGSGAARGEGEVREGERVVRRLLDAVDHLARKIGDELGAGGGGGGGGRDEVAVAAGELLERCQSVSLQLALSGLRAAAVAAPVLLRREALDPHSFAHEKSSQAKRLAALWDEAAKLTDRIGRRYPRHRLALYGELCEVYGGASRLALEMMAGAAGTEALRGAGGGGGEEEEEDSEDEAYEGTAAGSTDDGGSSGFPGGAFSGPSTRDSDVRMAFGLGGSSGGGGGNSIASVWGSGAAATAAWGGGGGGVRAGLRGGGQYGNRGGGGCGVTEQDIQAQAWVPALLQVLLNRASDAHRHLRNELASAEAARGGAALSGPEDEYGSSVQQPLMLAAGLAPAGSLGGSRNRGATGGVLWVAMSEGAVEALWGLLDEMQQSFAELAVDNLRRTAALCAAGTHETLAVWALESARDSAESALRFIHTHEHSSLALGDLLEMEAELGEDTRAWLQLTWQSITSLTTRVVNGLLAIRRRINVRRWVRRRGTDAGGRQRGRQGCHTALGRRHRDDIQLIVISSRLEGRRRAVEEPALQLGLQRQRWRGELVRRRRRRREEEACRGLWEPGGGNRNSSRNSSSSSRSTEAR